MTLRPSLAAGLAAATLLTALAGPGAATHDSRPPYYFAVDIVQTTPGGIPTVTAVGATCAITAWPSNAFVSCIPTVLENVQCMLPVVTVSALQATPGAASTVTGETGCDGTVMASASVLAPGYGSAVHAGHGYNFPFVCQADFTMATGSVHCHEPDP